MKINVWIAIALTIAGLAIGYVSGHRAPTGSIWGSGSVYTDDSALATAAVHAGALKDGESGIVRVTVLPGYNHYDGATSNGVTSQSYEQWQGSYRVDRL